MKMTSPDWMHYALAVVTTGLWIAVVYLAGCVPPNPPVSLPAAIPYCASRADVHAEDGCPDSYTMDGFPCAICAAASACVDPVGLIYCARSCLDRACIPGVRLK